MERDETTTPEVVSSKPGWRLRLQEKVGEEDKTAGMPEDGGSHLDLEVNGKGRLGKEGSLFLCCGQVQGEVQGQV